MEFKEILEKYEDDIKHADKMLDPKCLSFFKKSEDYWQGYKKACYSWFQSMKEYTDFVPQLREPTEKEKEEFTHWWYETNTLQKPDRILEYRDEIVPIYYDDYGQQEIVIFKGEIISGGAFNTMAEYDFCAFIDRIKDNIE